MRKMRKALFFIGMLVIASLFAGCSKDKDENLPVGTWESDIATVTYRGYPVPHNVKGKEIFTFYADKKVEWYVANDSYTYEGTYTTNGSSITMTFTYGLGQSFLYGPGRTFELTDVSSKESTIATVTKQTYQVKGNNLTIESIADAEFPALNLKTTYEVKTTYKRITE
jgi:hypothetical protein